MAVRSHLGGEATAARGRGDQRLGMSCETLSVYPEEIQFLDVRPNQTYIQTVEVGRASMRSEPCPAGVTALALSSSARSIERSLYRALALSSARSIERCHALSSAVTRGRSCCGRRFWGIEDSLVHAR